ncbi:MAG: 6-phosphogluconolactonase [Bryobacteraceae bacterium]
MNLNILADAREAAGACAAYIAAVLRQEIADHELATLAVSGGSTPRLMFDALANEPLDWFRVHIFFVDERPVPPGDPQSNYTLCETHLLKPAGVPAGSVHRILTERGPATAASLYSEEITGFFDQISDEKPCFTIIQCGIGPDCHTASLFPGETLIDDREGLIAAVEVAKLRQARITMLPRILLNAKTVVVLASGPEKAQPLRQAIHEAYHPKQFPAQLLFRDRTGVDLFADNAAAADLR